MAPVQYIVEGGHRLGGTIEPSGNKNAALPIIAAALLTTLIEARRDLKVSTVVGDKEMAALTQALTALDAARHATVDLHNGLAKIAKAMHVPVKMDVVKPQGEVEDRVTMRVAS